MVKISVIMPVYNVEDYLEEALNSIVNQTMIDDIEVLLIDDGSTDNSRYIIEKYALDYDNFYAFHKKNEGPAIARNFGLKKANGEFIHFMDSDDYIPPYAYEKLYNFNSDADYIIGNALRFGKYNVWEDYLFKQSFRNISHDINSTTIYEQPSLFWDTVIWNKIYKKEFLENNNIKFINDNLLYEDLLFSLEALLSANSIAIVDECIYYWRSRNNHSSITQSTSDFNNAYDRIKILKYSKELLDKFNLNDDLMKVIYLKWLNHDLRKSLINIANHTVEEIDLLISEINKVLNFIPIDLIDSLSSISKLKVEYIKNNKIDELLSLINFESILKHDSDAIDDKFNDLINIEEDFNYETINANVLNIIPEEDSLIISFDYKLNFEPKGIDPNIQAFAVDLEKNEYLLDVTKKDNYQIEMPISLMKNKEQINIKIKYNDEKETYLKNTKRKSIYYKEFDIDIDMGINKLLFLDFINKNDNNIEITHVEFENNEFKFYGNSDKQITNIFLKNIVTFEEIDIPLSYDGRELYFVIPYDLILNYPIKKWEINSRDCLNSIHTVEYEFFINNKKISIFNSRNKILIHDYILNTVDEAYKLNNKLKKSQSHNRDLKDEMSKLNKSYKNLKRDYKNSIEKNRKLSDKNKKLIKKNKKLNDEILRYKSRKIVKIADKLKKIY